MGRHQFGVAAGHVCRHTGVDPGFDVAVAEAPAQAVVPARAGRAGRFDAPRPAGQPRVEHDALAHLQTAGFGSQLDHLGDHLVAHDLRKRTERRHRVVGVTLAEVQQYLLGVRAADTGQPGSGDHPIVMQQSGIRYCRSATGLDEFLASRLAPSGTRRALGHPENQRTHQRRLAGSRRRCRRSWRRRPVHVRQVSSKRPPPSAAMMPSATSSAGTLGP